MYISRSKLTDFSVIGEGKYLFMYEYNTREPKCAYLANTLFVLWIMYSVGQFGKVFRASMQSGSGPISVAVKTAKKSTTSKDKEAFLREMTVMSQMVHPNIVQFYGVIRDGECDIYNYRYTYVIVYHIACHSISYSGGIFKGSNWNAHYWCLT